jgi:hypothetical protein
LANGACERQRRKIFFAVSDCSEDKSGASPDRNAARSVSVVALYQATSWKLDGDTCGMKPNLGEAVRSDQALHQSTISYGD